MVKKSDKLNTALRTDLLSHIRKVFETIKPGETFMPNYHIEAIAWQLERCMRGEVKRLIITLPPRNLKSLCASVAFPTHVLGHDPTCEIVCVSYSDDLTRSFSRDRRRVMEAPWYCGANPNTRLSKRKNTESEIVTTKGGTCLATSVGGTLTGRGARLMIIDDPSKAGEALSEAERKNVNDWFSNTAYTRLNNKSEDVIIVVMQRIHEDDLVGYVQELDDWVIVNFPAIAEEYEEVQISDKFSVERFPGDVLHPEREPLETLERIKRAVGSRNFSSQYQQSPVPNEGKVFKREWFKRCNPDNLEFSQIVQSWDTAAEVGDGTSFSVCQTWGIIEGRTYLLHIFRDRLIYPDLKARVIREARIRGANRVLIEKASTGTSLLQDLRNTPGLNLIPITPKKDKLERALQATALIEAGRVYLPTDAPGLATFENEVFAFPDSKYKDQVDAMTQFLLWWDHGGPRQLEVRVTTIPLRKTTYYERMGGSFPF